VEVAGRPGLYLSQVTFALPNTKSRSGSRQELSAASEPFRTSRQLGVPDSKDFAEGALGGLRTD